MPVTTPQKYSFWSVWQPEAEPVLTITPPTSVTDVAPIASIYIPAISSNVVVTAAANGKYNNQPGSAGYVNQGTIFGPATNVSFAFGPTSGLYPSSLQLYASPNAAPMYVLTLCSTEVEVSNVTAVTASLPLSSSGGAMPNISIIDPLPVAYGGSGTATPSLVAGANISVTGTWPNQTIAATGVGGVSAVTATAPLASSGGATPAISLTGIVARGNGGTGTATPALVAGSNISITGSWPNNTISATGVGGVSAVTATSPLASSGGTTPVISLAGLVPVSSGGTGTNTPGAIAGTNITLSGSWPNQTITSLFPVYDQTGTALASTVHQVTNQVTAAGASTTVTLAGAAIFATATYFLLVQNVATGAFAPVTAQTVNSFTFTSTSTDVYQYFALGA